MPNDYYERKADFESFTIARGDDVRNELDGIQSAFEKLPQPRKDGTIGFLTPFTIIEPQEDNHPATNKQVKDLGNTSTSHTSRLNNIENALQGMGPLNARYATLRYVATAGQTQIVLPARFQSLAYVHKNGLRLYQTVGFNYNVQTKTITFTSPLALNDVVLVDVGVVPDAVLADLIAIQNDIAQKHQDVSSNHADVSRWHTEVDQDKTIAVNARNAAQQAASIATSKAQQVSQDTAQVASDAATVHSEHTDVERWHRETDFNATVAVQARNAAQQAESTATSKAQQAASDAATVHSEHADVDRWHTEVSQDKTIVVSAKDETKATYAQLQKISLGAHATPPTTDNSGNPLTEGATYHNTTTHKTYTYTQGQWVVDRMSAVGLVEQTGASGAAILPAGGSADRPDPTKLVGHSIYLRGNTDTDKLEYAFGGQAGWHVLWRGQGGVEGDVVLGEHVLYADDGAIAIKDDDTNSDPSLRGLQIGDASASGQPTRIHSTAPIKVVIGGVTHLLVVGSASPGTNSVAVGDQAGRTSQGDYSVAVGNYAGQTSQGTESVAVGNLAGRTSQGDNSVAVGNLAGTQDQGTESVAVGDQAGQTSQGDNSVAVGAAAGQQNQGTNSVAVGLGAGFQSQPDNSICVGHNSSTTSANSLVVGAANYTVKIGDGNVQAVSDRRDKTDINYQGVHGLDFIMKLKTCTYRYDVRELYWERDNDGTITKHTPDGSKAGKRHHAGLIAQDVKATADELGFDFTGYRDERIAATEHHQEHADKKALVYTAFIPSLIKAIQEQQAQISSLTQQIESLKASS